MSNGLGAGFAALTMLAVLLGLALSLALTGGVAVVLDRRGNGPHAAVVYVAVTLLAGVVVVAGVGVLAMYDEAAVLAWVFASLVLVPLSVAGVALRRRTRSSRVGAGAAAAVGWSLPFVGGVVVTVGGVQLLQQALGLASGEVQSMGLPWMAAAVGGLLVTVATVAAAGRLRRPLGAGGDARTHEGR